MKLARLVALAPLLAVGCTQSNWVTNANVDPITDEMSVRAIAASTDGRSRLVVDCPEHIRIETQHLITNNIGTTYRVRFDAGEPASVVGATEMSNDSGQTVIRFVARGGLSRDGNDDQFVKGRLRGSGRFTMQGTNARGQTVNMIFNVAGAEDAFAAVRRHC